MNSDRNEILMDGNWKFGLRSKGAIEGFSPVATLLQIVNQVGESLSLLCLPKLHQNRINIQITMPQQYDACQIIYSRYKGGRIWGQVKHDFDITSRLGVL